MGTEVTITYTVANEEWKRTLKMRWADNVFPLNDCFYGRVSFRIEGREVLGTDHFQISVADLAVGLAHIVGELRNGANGVFKFQQSDDMLEISFQADGDSVLVTHNLAPGERWVCNRIGLVTAFMTLIVSFTGEAIANVPDVFEWKDLEILRSFSGEQTKV